MKAQASRVSCHIMASRSAGVVVGRSRSVAWSVSGRMRMVLACCVIPAPTRRRVCKR